MNLLDENIRQDQREQLREWRVPFRAVTPDLAHPGIQDSNILPLLHRLKRPTFFTHDRDFFERRFIHHAYSLVWLDVFDGHAAEFINRFLKHPAFNTAVKRIGIVAHVHHECIDFWQRNQETRQCVLWMVR